MILLSVYVTNCLTPLKKKVIKRMKQLKKYGVNNLRRRMEKVGYGNGSRWMVVKMASMVQSLVLLWGSRKTATHVPQFGKLM